MTPRSEQPPPGGRNHEARTDCHAGDAALGSGSAPKQRVGSTDITGCGGGLQPEPPYPPHIELSEEDDTDRLHSHSDYALSSSHQSQNPGGSPAHDISPLTSHTSPMTQYLINNPYLQTADIEEWHRQQAAKRTRSRGTQSSAPATDSSDYHSALDCASMAGTEVTEAEAGGDRGSGDRSNTPHYTPSHTTPSHQSEGTTEEDRFSGRAPEPPHPYSYYDPYNPGHGVEAVENASQHFNG